MKNEQTESIILSTEMIDHIADRIESTIADFNLNKRDALRIRLMSENMLQKILSCSDTPKKCCFSVRKRFGNGQIIFTYDGSPFDPFDENDDEFTAILMKNLGVPCEWKYQNDQNILQMSFKKRTQSSVPVMLAAVASAILLGIVSRWVPESLSTNASEHFLIPLKDKYISFLNGFAALLIFFNVMTGICGDKDTEPLSSKSKKIFIRMPIMLIIVTAMGYLLSLVFSDVTFSAHSNNSESQTGRIAQMLWDLIPEDVITPFQDKNYIHILMIALILGTAISVIRDSYPELIASLNGISQAFMSVTAKICRFVPVYVFCFLLSLIITSDERQLLSDVWKPVLLFIIISGIMIAAIYIIVSIRIKCSGLKLLKLLLPTLLICLTTGSPITAYSTNLEVLEKRCGVSKRFARVALPLSCNLYGAGSALYMVAMVMHFAGKYSVSIDISWLMTAILFTVMLIFACPPVPCSTLIIFSVFSKQFGFPEECMVILAMVDIVVDGLATAVGCALRNAELLLESNLYDELDKQK